MFHIYCPYCEELREEEEFHPKGQAHIARPEDPDACSDEEWGDYLFFRDNPRGIHHEMWLHAVGCRKFFNITRNTVSYEILETYKMGEQPTVGAEHLAREEKTASVQAAEGGQQTVGASDAALASVKGAQA
ncbi:sarcosine oxidase subunit delta [Chromohalobacter japonicus]|uniref:Sarcosine oxidase, delta subunit family n=4 Tax=Chromohalobacter TaxID=42054 RepID=Q1QYV2_CHRI1|nr:MULTISPECIES: sarcosine oxidase subunit delta [Chromohalobacter]ABE58356.1 sarcosine oxidase, delta subunit family [Chromohalobacter salexigens DSM 3043]OLO11166.1 sarcosine oxidase subunit delta [Chromohalobacter japonicus]SOC54735.1 sarcosine oxidase subunit delta [Chromohalobacter canadensis]